MNWLIDFLEKYQLPCFWKYLTGYDCMACGMQRAIIELLRGNILGSIQAYPALIPLIATITLGVIYNISKSDKLVIYFKISIIFTTCLIFINFFYKLFFFIN